MEDGLQYLATIAAFYPIARHRMAAAYRHVQLHRRHSILLLHRAAERNRKEQTESAVRPAIGLCALVLPDDLNLGVLHGAAGHELGGLARGGGIWAASGKSAGRGSSTQRRISRRQHGPHAPPPGSQSGAQSRPWTHTLGGRLC